MKYLTPLVILLAACSSSGPSMQQGATVSENVNYIQDHCRLIPDPGPGEPRYIDLWRIDENGRLQTDPLPGTPDGCLFDNNHWFGVGINPFDVLIGQ